MTLAKEARRRVYPPSEPFRVKLAPRISALRMFALGAAGAFVGCLLAIILWDCVPHPLP